VSTETSIQTQAVSYARSFGLMAKRNFMGPGAEVGWPDVEIFGHGGKVLFIEFKAPGKEPRKLQKHRIQRLRNLGHSVYVCDSFDVAKALIHEVFEI